jgi:uncharacterized protein YdaU (DUF1376 family)
MALRNQPYFPLYVQDYLTDEKLNMCSAASQGVYVKIMCIFHKSEQYGGVLLKQKDKQNEQQILNFAYRLARLLPFTESEVTNAVTELVDEGVLSIDGDFLYQKRMVKDGQISDKRSNAGKTGGEKTSQKFKQSDDFAKAKVQAKTKQNTEYEYEYENEDKGIERVQGEKGVQRRPEPALAVSPEFVKALAIATCELFNIEQINNARAWMDVHYFVKEVAADARKFEYLKSQTVWYKKLTEQGRPLCAVRNWMSTYWNEQDYEKLWKAQNTTQFGTKKKANELTGSDFMEIQRLGR